MTLDEALARLRPMQSNLRARRVAALCLFGSTARNEARPDLGDDPMCDFEEIRSISLFDVFYIEEAPADELGRKTDVSERKTLRPRIHRRADEPAVRVF